MRADPRSPGHLPADRPPPTTHASHGWVAAVVVGLALALPGPAQAQAQASPPPRTDLPVVEGLRLWLRADRGLELTPGQVVAAWRDQSGLGHDAVQADPARRPKLVQSSIQGRPAVRFDGEDDVLGLVDTQGEAMTALTVLMAHRPNRRPSQSYTGDYFVLYLGGDGDQRYRYWGFETLGSAGGNSSEVVDVLSGWGNDMRMRRKGLSTFGKVSLWCASTDGNIHRTRMHLDGAECVGRPEGVDGPIRIKIGNADGTGAGGLGGSQLLDDRTHSSSSEIAEVIVFNRVLTEPERKAMEKYLGQRYSIPLSSAR